MPQSYTDFLGHFVFSTKDRLPQITADIRERLFAYLGGIAKNHKAVALEVGGVEDHVHILAALHPTIAPADFVRLIKTNSSKWVHDTWPRKRFAWQEGYGGFSVSRSNVPEVRRYIRGQEGHHRKVDFKTEFLEFLKRHEVDYNPKYIWD